MKRIKKHGVLENGAGTYFRRPIKAACKVVGTPKGWTLLKLNDLQRKVERCGA